MHRRMRDQLEDVLAGEPRASQPEHNAHLKGCAECREEMEGMRQQAQLLRRLRAPSEAEPRAGFYARVLERIEAQGPVSIWNLFFDSNFGRRIAIASMALALLIGVYVISSEQTTTEQTIVITGQPVISDQILGSAGPFEAQPAAVLAGAPDTADSVLMSLVTYQEQ